MTISRAVEKMFVIGLLSTITLKIALQRKLFELTFNLYSVKRTQTKICVSEQKYRWILVYNEIVKVFRFHAMIDYFLFSPYKLRIQNLKLIVGTF